MIKMQQTQDPLKQLQEIYEDESSVARNMLFILQDLTEEIKVEKLSYGWKKYLASLFKSDNSAC